MLYDITSLGSTSQFCTAKREYMIAGIPESEAEWRAFLDCMSLAEIQRLLETGWEEGR